MHEIFIWFKGIGLVAFIWCIEPLMTFIASFGFMGSTLRLLILESKELIGLFISILTLIYIIRKNIKLKNNKDVN